MVAAGLFNDIAYGQLSMRKAKTAVLGQALFLALALVIPMITHRLGLNFLVAQPMHWMILFAGLAYGPLSGALMGLSVPLASFALTGMPLPAMLPLMLPELAVYGLAAGLLKGRLTAFGAVAAALIAGRAVFLALSAASGPLALPPALGGQEASALEFIRRVWGPGLPAMALQIALLPALAGLYVRWARD